MIWEKRKKKCARTQLYDDVMFGERPSSVPPPALPPPRQGPYENVHVNEGFIPDTLCSREGFQCPMGSGDGSGGAGERERGEKGKKVTVWRKSKSNGVEKGEQGEGQMARGQGEETEEDRRVRGGSRAATPTRRVYQNAEVEGEGDGRTSRGSQTSRTSTGLAQRAEPYDDVSLSLSRKRQAKSNSLPQTPSHTHTHNQSIPYARSLSDVHPHPSPHIQPPPRPLSAHAHSRPSPAHSRPSPAHPRPVPAQRLSLSLRASDASLPLDDVYCEVGEQFSLEHPQTGASKVPAPPVRNSSKQTKPTGGTTPTKGSRPPGIKPPLKPKPKKETLRQWLGRKRGSRGKDPPPPSPDDLIDVTMVENDVYESEDVRKT